MSGSNKIRMVCVIVIVVSGYLSILSGDYQKEARGNWSTFIGSFDIEEDLQKKYGFLTRKEKASLNLKLGAQNIEKIDELWAVYTYKDYWYSIFKTVTAIAFIIVVVTYLRGVLDRIPVSEKLYRMLYLPPEIKCTDNDIVIKNVLKGVRAAEETAGSAEQRTLRRTNIS